MTELSYDRMININAEGDKNTSFNIGVWQGNVSLTVFSNRNNVVRIPMNRTFQVSLMHELQKLLTGKPGDKESWNFSKWDPETKKSVPVGAVVVGRDDKAMFYIGVQSSGHAPMKFLLKAPISFDMSSPMSDVKRSELAAATIVEQLRIDIPHACMNTSFKRTDVRTGTGASQSHSNTSDISFF